jgi:nitrate reductase assembly molybdenum cofactor insertion protein NarJ
MREPGVSALLREAAEWRLLGLLLERPREGWRQEVEALNREVSDPEIGAAVDAARQGATEGRYLAVLGPGGPVSPREVTYRGMEDPGHILGDLMAFYEAFTFRPETEEAPDHLSVEAGFLGYLCLKAAYARASGDEGNAEVAAQAAERFREAHLAAFAWPLAGRLAKTDVHYLTLAASALARRSGPRGAGQGEETIPLRICEDCSLECGEA